MLECFQEYLAGEIFCQFTVKIDSVQEVVVDFVLVLGIVLEKGGHSYLFYIVIHGLRCYVTHLRPVIRRDYGGQAFPCPVSNGASGVGSTLLSFYNTWYA